jgi:hypothetical protein
MEENKIILKYPIEYKTAGGAPVTVTEVALRRMKAKDLKLVNIAEIEGNPSVTFPLIAALSGLPLEAVDEIDMVDMNDIIGLVGSFLSGSPTSGKTSSGG